MGDEVSEGCCEGRTAANPRRFNSHDYPTMHALCETTRFMAAWAMIH